MLRSRDAADGMDRRAVSGHEQSRRSAGHRDPAPATIPDICHEPLGQGHPDGAVIAEVAAWQQQVRAGNAGDRCAERLAGTGLPATLRHWPHEPVIDPLAPDRVKGQAGKLAVISRRGTWQRLIVLNQWDRIT